MLLVTREILIEVMSDDVVEVMSSYAVRSAISATAELLVITD